MTGFELRKWRRDNGNLAQCELAGMLDVGTRTIARLEGAPGAIPRLYSLAIKQLEADTAISKALALVADAHATLKAYKP